MTKSIESIHFFTVTNSISLALCQETLIEFQIFLFLKIIIFQKFSTWMLKWKKRIPHETNWWTISTLSSINFSFIIYHVVKISKPHGNISHMHKVKDIFIIYMHPRFHFISRNKMISYTLWTLALGLWWRSFKLALCQYKLFYIK